MLRYLTLVIVVLSLNFQIPSAMGQGSSLIEHTFFSTTITTNQKPLQAGSIFHDSKDNLVIQGLPLRNVISWVFGVNRFQVVDGPDWITTPHLYDIEAVPPPSFIDSDEQLMMKALLSDRFNLVAQFSHREMPVLVLELDSDARKPEPAPADRAPFRMYYINNNAPDIVNLSLATVDNLAEFLTGQLGRLVINLTGLDGTYHIDLLGVDRTDEANLTEAMLLQLGIKLKAGTVPVEVLAIEHIERPTLDM